MLSFTFLSSRWVFSVCCILSSIFQRLIYLLFFNFVVFLSLLSVPNAVLNKYNKLEDYIYTRKLEKMAFKNKPVLGILSKTFKDGV